MTGFTSCRLVWSGGVGGMRLAGADAAAAGRHVGGCEPSGISHHRWQPVFPPSEQPAARVSGAPNRRTAASKDLAPWKQQQSVGELHKKQGHKQKGNLSAGRPS